MEDALKIYLTSLRGGKVEKIRVSVPPDFLEVVEPDLRFQENIDVAGEVYVADEELVIHLNMHTQGTIPCSICNGPVAVPVHVKEFYHIEPLENIRSGVFDMKELIRENVLLETPTFVECHEGHCPSRKELGKYLKASSDESTEAEDGYRPFSNL